MTGFGRQFAGVFAQPPPADEIDAFWALVAHHDGARIYDRLIQQFGRGAVFKDVDSMPFGVDFRVHLDTQVAKCEVFLVVIGRGWVKKRESKGKSRLDDPGDFVRIEVESALKRQIPVIPVLVIGAEIPPPGDFRRVCKVCRSVTALWYATILIFIGIWIG